MQLFGADDIVFSKDFKKKFDPEKVKKRASKVAHNPTRPFYFTVQPRPQPTAHSPELIFHVMKYRDQTSVLLSLWMPAFTFLTFLTMHPLWPLKNSQKLVSLKQRS